jgi:carbon-monoxide dehydrogenase medium subunit
VQELSYHRPESVADAVALVARQGARALAGGTDLIPQLREGRRSARAVVDLKHISELTAITRQADGGWRIGAAASVSRLGDDAAFATEHAGLLESARLIGSLQIQSRATLGGNLCNAAPSADALPLLISLGAEAEIAGAGGRRRAPVEALLAGPGRTRLDAGEIVVALHLPARPPRSATRYLRFTPRREMDIAVAGSGVVLALDARGLIAAARVTLASVAPTPLRAATAEAVLAGARPSRTLFAEAAVAAAADARPISDTRGSADYRRQLVAVLTRRALAACAAEIGVAIACERSSRST